MESENPYITPKTELDGAQETGCKPAFWSRRGRIGRMRFFSYIMTFNLYSLLIVTSFSMMKRSGVVTPSLALAGLFLVIAYLPTLISWVVMAKRRMFDLNKSGPLVFLMLVPLVNIGFWVYLVSKPGDQQSNHYGLPPVGNGVVLSIWAVLQALFCCVVFGFFVLTLIGLSAM